MLLITSVLYHSTHRPWLRALDISVLWVLALSGSWVCFAGLVTGGANAYLVAVAVEILTINLINSPRMGKRTHYSHDPLMIRLEFHALLHMLTCTALSFLALGVPSSQPA